MNKPYRGPIEVDVNGTPVIIQFSPTSQKLHWSYSVNGLISETVANAQSEILFSLFVFTDQNIANSMYANYLKNNLEIYGVLEPKFAYRNYSESLDLWGLKLLNENCEYELNNKPWRYPLIDTVGAVSFPRGDMLHHKFAVVDRETLIFGSHNWSDAANYINDEFVIILKNKEIAESFVTEFDRIFSNVRMGPSQSLLTKIEEFEQACR
jgi:phosphatidylserine/phosphatidylglycerophosphate/cardiolipin synthase-like enzyme